MRVVGAAFGRPAFRNPIRLEKGRTAKGRPYSTKENMPMLDIKITKNNPPRPKPDGPLGFGRIFTDHMFLMDYTQGKGWHDPRIVPYADLVLSPSCMVFHYGQEVFEGLKAYQGADGAVYLFRPERNGMRTNATNDRLCIPEIPVEDFVQAVSALVNLDADWVPAEPGTSLYIRPFIIATEPFLGVAPSKQFLFAIIASPSGMYYSDGLKPIHIWVEDEYVRAVRGGVGFAKTGGNYAASLAAQQKAQREGYAQVLWLDGVERKYVEEVGAMNVFFYIGDTIVTPVCDGTLLEGITRMSCIELLRKQGYTVEERKISIDEVMEAGRNGTLKEAFGTGTAVVIAPIGELCYGGEKLVLGNGGIGTLTQGLYDTLTGVQYGIENGQLAMDNWTVEV